VPPPDRYANPPDEVSWGIFAAVEVSTMQLRHCRSMETLAGYCLSRQYVARSV